MLFLEAQDEAEFAGMLAQAMERILRGSARRTDQPASLATIPLIFMGNGCSENEMIPLVKRNTEMRSDSTVMQADRLAVATLVQAGFDPEDLLHYLERVTARPNATERAENIRSVLNLQPQASYIVDESEFANVRQEVGRLTERQSAVHTVPTLLPQ